MDTLQLELAKLGRDANFTQSIADVDHIIEQLERAREAIVEGENSYLTLLAVSKPLDRVGEAS